MNGYPVDVDRTHNFHSPLGPCIARLEPPGAPEPPDGPEPPDFTHTPVPGLVL